MSDPVLGGADYPEYAEHLRLAHIALNSTARRWDSDYDDAVQVALIAGWKAGRRFDETGRTGNRGNYIYGSMHNALTQMIRDRIGKTGRKAPYANTTPLDVLIGQATDADCFERAEAIDQLERLIASAHLSSTERLTVDLVLADADVRHYAAHVAGVTEGALHQAKRRAMRKLRAAA